MFDSLTEKLNRTFKNLRGRGRLTEKNIQDALKEVRLALLEADVNYKVVKRLVEDIRQRAVGQEVLESLTPGQQVIKVVSEELVRLMGETGHDLDLSGRPPFVLMLVGLQGSGKTTTAAKLARHLRSKGRHPYLVPADVYRPAAIDQLKKLGERADVPVHPSEQDRKPEDLCEEALERAQGAGCDIVILDTAGRLHVDEALMQELARIKDRVTPREILLVADAMTGQDAVNVAKHFDELLGLSGVILTKTEGDARGGAVLSIRAVTDTPIKFIGVGEKLDALEAFHPDRMASRILGMGDVLSLIEKAQTEFDESEAKRLQERIKKREFDLEDFREQLKQVKKLGSLEQILGMLPGMGQLKQLKKMKPDERELVKIEAIICSMTLEERRNHKIINGSRRKRIARGSGTKVQDVNRLLKNFAQTKKTMEQLTRKGMRNMPSLIG
jgi:signal recognition particle subunit SRP54